MKLKICYFSLLILILTAQSFAVFPQINIGGVQVMENWNSDIEVTVAPGQHAVEPYDDPGTDLSLHETIETLDSDTYAERQAAYSGLVDEFESWLEHMSVYHIDGAIDTIEYQLSPYRDMSREAAARIDEIIKALRDYALDRWVDEAYLLRNPNADIWDLEMNRQLNPGGHLGPFGAGHK